MIIPGSSNPLLFSADDSYQIQRSLRFNSADSTYLVRQNGGSDSNRKVWTLSFWMKPSVISTVGTPGDGPHLFMVGNTNPNGGGGPSTYSRFLLTGSSNNLVWGSSGSSGEAFTSTNVFRDLSAWYHVVVSFDAGNTIIRCYVNNQEITYASRTNPSNTNSAVNAANYYNSFGIFHTGDVRGWNGYLTEFNFIDGQALTPSSFGATNASTGVWSPIKYTGTYGTNGFYLNFSDNSGTTSTTLGKDSSGNGNNWTPNNFSVTAGAGNDSLVDTPTPYGTDTGAGGEVRGNYATLNPLQTGSYATLANGNLQITGNTVTNSGGSIGTMSFTSGKYYWELVATTVNSTAIGVGATTVALTSSALNDAETYATNYGFKVRSSGAKEGIAGEIQTFTMPSFTSGDIIGIAVDADNGAIYVSKNNVWVNSGSPTSGSSRTGSCYNYTPSASRLIAPFYSVYFSGSGDVGYANLGQRPFSYTPPSGYKALCTTNLSAGTITTSGSFTGNAAADGPFVYLNGVPTAMTINGNSVTFGTHADKLSNGFKVRSSSSSYNASGSNTYSITTTGDKFKNALAQANP